MKKQDAIIVVAKSKLISINILFITIVENF